MKVKQYIKFISDKFFFIFFLMIIFFVPQISQAVVKADDLFSAEYSHVDFIDDPFGMAEAAEFGLSTGGDEMVDPRVALVNIVKYLLSFVGIIAVSMIMRGGFELMVASGSEDSIAGARKTIINGIIGLVIIISSYPIVGTIVNTVELLITGAFVDKLS